MIILDLPIPAGFALDSEDFESLKSSEKIAKYQLTARSAIVYLRELRPGEPLAIHYHLRATMPIKITAPAARVYEYYNPDHQAATGKADGDHGCRGKVAADASPIDRGKTGANVLLQHVAIGVVPELAPSLLVERSARKEGDVCGLKRDAHSDCRAAGGEVAWDQEFVVAETPVRGLDNMLRRAGFFLRVE